MRYCMYSFLGKNLQNVLDSESSTSGIMENTYFPTLSAKWTLNKMKTSWKVISDSPKNL